MSEAQIAGGHKANLNNPGTSQEAKDHSKQVLDDEFNGGDVPHAEDKQGDKNPNNVAGGLKAYVCLLCMPSYNTNYVLAH